MKVTPTCCPEVQVSAAVFLGYDDWSDCSPTDPPVWLSLGQSEFAGVHDQHRASFCPHCAAPLPAIRRREAPGEKFATWLDGGYYCDTCSQRLNECSCRTPAEAWEPAP